MTATPTRVPVYGLRPDAPRTLGTVAVVFGVLLALWSLLTLVGGGQLGDPDDFSPTALVVYGIRTTTVTTAMSAVMLAMSLSLAVIGNGLRRYERWALPSTIRWSLGALVIAGIQVFFNATIVGPAIVDLCASSGETRYRQIMELARNAGLWSLVLYAPFPVVLLANFRRPALVAAMDQPRRR